MAAQRLDVDHLLAASPSLLPLRMEMSSFAARFASTQTVVNQGLRAQGEWHPEAVVNLRLLGKGVGWAFGIEGVAAMCLYAIWFVWHFRP